jgi:hypothetical protein
MKQPDKELLAIPPSPDLRWRPHDKAAVVLALRAGAIITGSPLTTAITSQRKSWRAGKMHSTATASAASLQTTKRRHGERLSGFGAAAADEVVEDGDRGRERDSLRSIEAALADLLDKWPPHTSQHLARQKDRP